MKGFSQILIIIYSVTAFYFLYQAAIGIFVYFANKNLGHYESFLVPGRNLALGLILASMAFGGWKHINNPSTYKFGMFIVYFPVGIVALIILWVVFVFITNGGK